MRGTRPRSRLLLTTAAPLALTGLVALTVRPTVTVPVAGTTYQLRTADSGGCLDVTPGPTSTEGPPQRWQCRSSPGWQRFTLQAAGPGRFRLSNERSRMCVDLPAGAADGLRQEPCSTTRTEQLWRLIPTGSGSYRIGNLGSGLCIAGRAADPGSGVSIVQQTCAADSPAEAWTFQPV